MEDNEDLTKKQEIKKQFFSAEPIFFSKKSKYIYSNLKDTTTILSNIASTPRFKNIKQQYSTKLFLSKFLLASHIHWVLYAYCKGNILYIATANHIGQNELNLQKLTILNYCHKSNNYKHIENISIFRDKNFNDKNKEDIKIKEEPRFAERSYGIFDENVTNPKQQKILHNIKKYIKDNRTK